jgi:hypothetical protein
MFFLVAFIIWLIAKKLSPKLSYKSAYVIAIYASTAGLLLNLVLGLFAPSLKFPFTTSLIAILIFILNFSNLPKNKKKA